MNKKQTVRNALGPEELRLAGKAFEAALSEVGESDLHPYAIRKKLAEQVIQKIFAGETSLERLRDDALAALREMESPDAAQAAARASLDHDADIAFT